MDDRIVYLFAVIFYALIMQECSFAGDQSIQKKGEIMLPVSIAGCETVLFNRKDQPEDYAYVSLGQNRADWVIVLHGHGSHGDQLFTRDDMKTVWLPALKEMGVSILAPNLRDNAWMNPEAVSDLHYLIEMMRNKYGAKRFFLMGGSMGGTGALIYTIRHPQDISAVWAGCPATDLPSYLSWLGQKKGIFSEIRQAIETGYNIPGENTQQLLQRHSTLQNIDQLTMPVFIQHGTADKTIPFEQSKQLQEMAKEKENIRIEAIPDGGHDAPIRQTAQLEWMKEQVMRH